MKTITDYINEDFKISRKTKISHEHIKVVALHRISFLVNKNDFHSGSLFEARNFYTLIARFPSVNSLWLKMESNYEYTFIGVNTYRSTNGWWSSLDSIDEFLNNKHDWHQLSDISIQTYTPNHIETKCQAYHTVFDYEDMRKLQNESTVDFTHIEDYNDATNVEQVINGYVNSGFLDTI